MKLIANTFFLAIIWRRYKRLFVAVGLLFASYFLVSLLHVDYLDYVKNSGNDTYLGLSYAIKWAILLFATLLFYSLITKRFTKESKAKKPEHHHSDIDSQDKSTPDPFDKIRHKKNLRGRADQFLDDGDKS